LENSERFMKITDITIAGNAGGYGKHNFTLKVVTYVLTI
jgi:hypothetical protein